MKIRLTIRRIFILIIVIAIIGGIAWYQSTRPPEYYIVTIGGKQVPFRIDPREAASVPVYPDEASVYSLIRSPIISRIDIVFKPADEKDNPLYVVEGFEIARKLSMLYEKWQRPPEFKSYPVDSYENLTGKLQNPIIAMIHPVYSNETAVRVQNRTIFISGTDAHKFDLATVKFLMIAFNITMPESNI